jgi:hypothetical protein
MANTLTTFDNMLKDYMPYELLFEEVMKRDYFLLNVEKDQSWCEGPLQVPFMGGHASSFAYGQLTDQDDVTEDRPVRGEVNAYREIWGTMKFHQRDLDQHGSLEKSFLKILPDRLEDFVSKMKEIVSVNLLNGTHFANYDDTSAANDLANGIIATDRPARFTIGQYVEIGPAGGPASKTGYVSAINIDDKTVTIDSQIDLAGGAVDLTAVTAVAVDDRFYVRGAITSGNAFTSLRDQLLSLANGGSANLFGQSKLAYPHLQAPNFDGSGITAANILDQIFDFYNETRTLGKGAPTDVIMSYKNLGSAMKALEGGLVGGASTVSGRKYTATDSKASAFGWTEIEVVGVTGKLKLVGVQEMDDDIMYILDWRALKLHSNEFFERRTAPDGKQFYEVRATTGYQYFVDTRFYGELVVSKPSHCGVIQDISY